MSEFIDAKVAEQYNALMSIIGGCLIDETRIERVVVEKVNDILSIKIKGINFTVEANQRQIRILNGRINTVLELPEGSSLNDARLEDIKVSYDGTVYSSPGEAVRALGIELKDSKERTMRTKDILTSSSDLNDITEPGMYYVNYTNMPSNMPVTTTALVNVFKGTAPQFGFGTLQMVHNDENTWTRYASGSGWGEWYKTIQKKDIDNILDLGFYRRVNLNATQNVNDVRTMGVYYVYSGDMPSGLPTARTGVLIVFKPTSGTIEHGVVQLYTTASESYIRYANTAGFQEWKSITGGGEGGGNGTIGGYDYVLTKDFVQKIMKPWTVKSVLHDTQRGKTYNVGDIVPTMPYKSTFSVGRDILYNSNLNAFYSMADNPASDLYMGDEYGYYGSVCSTLSGWLCGQEIYYTTTELFDVLNFYTFNGANLRIGDNMLKEGHSRLISDILVDSEGKITNVGVSETGGPFAMYTMYGIDGFKALLKENGGEYLLGRFADYKSVEAETIDYPTDCYPSKGHKSTYKMGEQITMYCPTGTNIYYRKKGGVYQSVTIMSLPKVERNGKTVHDITNLINTPGVWEVSTNTNNKPNELLRYTTGVVNIIGNEFTMSGYSAELTPLWYYIVKLNKTGPNQNYHSPVGYNAYLDYGNKHLIEGSRVSFKPNEPYDGYYVRVLYKTPYGQVYGDSEYVLTSDNTGVPPGENM